MHTRPSAIALRFFPLALLAFFLVPGSARAELTTLEGTEAPLVRIVIRTGTLQVKTWDRATVQVDGDPSLLVTRTMRMVGQNTVPILSGRIAGPGGPVVLPEESFVISTLPPGRRDVIVIRGGEVGLMTLTIPQNTAALVTQLGNGRLAISDYRNGTIVARLRTGAALLVNDGGDAFVQILRGPLVINDSSFNRLRTRDALGNTIFERVHVRQIEAMSISGSIVYDGGSFESGLAHFESGSGNIALGIEGAAQVGGRSASGKVYTLFQKHAQIESREGEANVILNGGGPVVTAATGSGRIFIYDGSLRRRQRLPEEWRAPQATLHRDPFQARRHGRR